ncbi:peptide chain release factor N(5)-glutamine methyltransferase [Sphingomonas sp.]|jgi:release factor glutamine methyltransferase|uniref:peptide chain release factor N(5)-glutamine methyltransferase n=1 Tax=Sphingomonas sp. TaxID=28214 RepID=UPI002D7E57B1|nr:peptide chain release factor N(5)-glutamine methyltransferase [Sphingomonas sp.]HEU0044189.1 peptide chain release factor N(5)-glutamine methyltransferase [Sphingomonas sp.]
MTVCEALRDATARFAFSATPRLDAELILAHALGIERHALLSDPARPVPPTFAALVERRAAQEPVAYITGTRGFWTIDLEVGPGVLIPRADSETLIEAAVAHFAGTPGPRRILDLGVGSGTLLLAALDQWPEASGLGIEQSPAALTYAQLNARALGMAARVAFRNGDWADGIGERFDLVLANPPYIAEAEPLPEEVSRYEPAEALFAGADGLDAYRRIAPALPRLLAHGGIACIEIGHEQANAVSALLTAHGLTINVHQDLGGRDRCVTATP